MFLLLICVLFFGYWNYYFFVSKFDDVISLVQIFLYYIDLTDVNLYYSFFFCYFLLNIFFTPIFLKKSLNLYWFLIYMLFSFILFNFSSFVGFLILVELTTITFINVLVLMFSNYFSRFQLNNVFWLLTLIICLLLGDKYQYNILNIYEYYVDYYELFGTFYWNDFIGLYNYLFFTQTFSILFLAVWFILITLCLIFLLKNVSITPVLVGLQSNINIFHWFFELFNDLEFKQDTFYWECTTQSPIEKFC